MVKITTRNTEMKMAVLRSGRQTVFEPGDQ
jgi:hypothetical protein